MVTSGPEKTETKRHRHRERQRHRDTERERQTQREKSKQMVMVRISNLHMCTLLMSTRKLPRSHKCPTWLLQCPQDADLAVSEPIHVH